LRKERLEGRKEGRIEGLLEAKGEDIYEILEERFSKVLRGYKMSCREDSRHQKA